MKTTIFTEDCLKCVTDRYLTAYPADSTTEQRMEYMKSVMKILSEVTSDIKAPELVTLITGKQKEIFGKVTNDYTKEKLEYNSIMLSLESKLEEEIQKSTDPLMLSVGYALTGNYIDFGAVDVNETDLYNLLDNAKNISVDTFETEAFRKDILSAKNLVYLTDNCGEVVMDKLLIKTIQKLNPGISVTVIVRGFPVLNDATMEDAKQIGLTEICPVIGNGDTVAGTCLERISKEALEKIDSADVIIAKGMANFETLFPCGRNVYYMFMCKCHMFARFFGVPKFTNMLVNDLRADNG